MKSIKYFLRDSVIINGEESNVYYALIAEIKRATNQVRVQWLVSFSALLASAFKMFNVLDFGLFVSSMIPNHCYYF